MSKSFELFEIVSNTDRLQEFRKELLRTTEGNIVSKVISSDQRWFYHREGVYDVEKMMGASFFEMTLIPLTGHSKLVEDFINYGSSNRFNLKAIRYEGEDIFLYTPGDINKFGRTFSVKPVIIINEDIYNLEKIIARDFSSLTVEDLRKYRDFFTVSDKPYMVVEEARIEDLYRTKQISLADYKRQLHLYEQEEKLVKTLRK